FDVLKDQIAGSFKAGTDPYFRCRTPNRLECLLQRQHEPAWTAGAKRQVSHQRLKLGVLLSPKTAARIRSKHANLSQWQIEKVRHGSLQEERMLNRTPNLQNILFGQCNEPVRFDRKLRDHWKRIGILHDEVGLLRVDVTPAIVTLFKDVGGGERIT